jgi:hypothetical protein
VAVSDDRTPDPLGAEPVVFDAHDRPTAIDDVEVALFEGEAVLFDVDASMVHHLNAVPAATWLCCDGETTVAQMIAELADAFEVEEPADLGALTAAVHDSLTRFATEGLLAGHTRVSQMVMTPVPVTADDGTEILTLHDDP